jgi:isoaspartyl peptidase/L-asparaginase-like protein (Ntn-hydrolase superfamily)
MLRKEMSQKRSRAAAPIEMARFIKAHRRAVADAEKHANTVLDNPQQVQQIISKKQQQQQQQWQTNQSQRALAEDRYGLLDCFRATAIMDRVHDAVFSLEIH